MQYGLASTMVGAGIVVREKFMNRVFAVALLHASMMALAWFGWGSAGATTMHSTFDGTLNAVHLSSDNRLLVGGEFEVFGQRRLLMRIDAPTGTGTDGFLPANGAVHVLDESDNFLPDSPGSRHFLVGGSFSGPGYPSYLAWVSLQGNVDPSFNLNLDGPVHALARVSPGTAVDQYVAGEFSGTILRITPGGVNPNFNPPDINGGPALALASDGNGVFLGGRFLSIDGAGQLGQNLFRLRPDGSVDDSFHFDHGAFAHVEAIAIQPDGRILIGGNFNISEGPVARRNLARLHPDGSIDASFAPSVTFTSSHRISDIAIQPDGRVVVVGDFDVAGGASRHVGRFSETGQWDMPFSFGINPDAPVNALAVQGDGGVAFVGGFTSVSERDFRGLAVVSRYLGLEQISRYAMDTGTIDEPPRVAAVQRDGHLVIGGDFTEVHGQGRRSLARLLGREGMLDAGFAPQIDGAVYAIAIEADGHMVIGGNFTGVDGVPVGRVARLTPDGQVDTGFLPAVDNGRIVTLAIAQNGDIYAGGTFTEVEGLARPYLVRLDGRTGAMDMDFQPGSGAGPVYAIALDWRPDRIYVGADDALFRLFEDGSGDDSFRAATGPFVSPEDFNAITALALHPENGVYAGGSFDGIWAWDGPTASILVDGFYNQFTPVNIARFFDDGTGDSDHIAHRIVQPLEAMLLSDNIVRAIARTQGSVRTEPLTGGLLRNQIDFASPWPSSAGDHVWLSGPLATPLEYSGFLDADGFWIGVGAFQAPQAGLYGAHRVLRGSRRIPSERLVLDDSGLVRWLRRGDGPQLLTAPVLMRAETCCDAAAFEPVGVMTRGRFERDFTGFREFNGQPFHLADGKTWELGLPRGDAETIYLKAVGRIGDNRGTSPFETPVYRFERQPSAAGRVDLTLTATPSLMQVSAHEPLTLTFTVANNGPDPATGVRVGYRIPQGFQLDGVTESQGDFLGSAWAVGTLAAGAQATLTVELTTLIEGGTAHAASTTAEQIELNPADNALTVDVQRATVQVGEYELVGVEQVGEYLCCDPVPIGEIITLRMTARNNGFFDIRDAWMDVDFGNGAFGFVSATPSQGTFSPVTGRWLIGNMNGEGAGLPLIEYTLDLELVFNGPLGLVSADLKAPALDLDPDNNTGSVFINQPPIYRDYGIVKTVSPTEAEPGDEVVFTLEVTTLSAGVSGMLLVVDEMPAGFSYVSHTAQGGSFNPDTMTWNIISIGQPGSLNDSVTAEITAVVNPVGPHVNVANIISPNDPDQSNNSDSAEVIVSGALDDALFSDRFEGL
jgi:uncharacterized delta-60 repeat protein/uncharacterized repeat protein (TIGR01451 family)